MVDKALFTATVVATSKWATPPELFARLHKKHSFSVDAAANRKNAKLPRWWGPNSPDGVRDCLSHDWQGETVFLNPPYGADIRKFVEKAWMESCKEGTTVVCLLPSRTDSAWFQDFASKASKVIFIRGRIKFVGAKNSAPFPNCLVIFSGTTNVPTIGFWDLKKKTRKKKNG